MIAILYLILDSVFFIFGENQKICSVFLLLFLVPTTVIVHILPFHLREVFINLVLISGLIIVAHREPKKLKKENQIFFYFFSLNSGKQLAMRINS